MKKQETELTVIENQLPEIKEAIENSGMTKQEAQSFLVSFVPNIKTLSELLPEVKKINTENPTEEDCASAKELRLKILKNRTASDNTKKSIKAEFLMKGNLVQGIYNIIEKVSKENEDALSNIEKFLEIKEANEKAELKAKREAELGKYMDNVSLFPLGEIAEEAYQDILQGQIQLKKSKEVAEQKALLETQRRDAINPYLSRDFELPEIELADLSVKDFAGLLTNAKIVREEKEAERKLNEERQKIINGRINTLSSMGFSYNNKENNYFFAGTNFDGTFACELIINNEELNSSEKSFNDLLAAHANIIGKIEEAKQEEKKKKIALQEERVKELSAFDYVPASLDAIASLDTNEWPAFVASIKQAYDDKKEKELLQKQLDDQKKELKASRLKRLEKYGFILTEKEIESMLKMSNEGYDNYISTIERGWQKQQEDLKAEQEAAMGDKAKMQGLFSRLEDFMQGSAQLEFKSKKYKNAHIAIEKKLEELKQNINSFLTPNK